MSKSGIDSAASNMALPQLSLFKYHYPEHHPWTQNPVILTLRIEWSAPSPKSEKILGFLLKTIENAKYTPKFNWKTYKNPSVFEGQLHVYKRF